LLANYRHKGKIILALTIGKYVSSSIEFLSPSACCPRALLLRFQYRDN